MHTTPCRHCKTAALHFSPSVLILFFHSSGLCFGLLALGLDFGNKICSLLALVSGRAVDATSAIVRSLVARVEERDENNAEALSQGGVSQPALPPDLHHTGLFPDQ